MRKRYQDYYEVEVAREVGLNAAAVATFLWRRIRYAPDMKYRHGHAWIKAFYGLMSFAMPFLTKAQARYAVGKLMDKGYIKKGHYSDDKFDRTNWYALTPYGAAMMGYGEYYEEEDD